MNTLFGHIIVSKLGSQAENIATESLRFILSNQNAQIAFQRFVRHFENRIGNISSIQTQDNYTDKGIPDLVCYDDKRKPIVIVESKFWAALTENQPLSYLKLLKDDVPSILLFLAPSKRVLLLWNELATICKNNKIILVGNHIKDASCSKINSNHSLVVSSWSSLLGVLQTEIDLVGDLTSKADLIELSGLCSRMDSEAFLPLDFAELSPAIASRNIQFADLVEKVVDKGRANGFSSESGKLRTTKTPYIYGRYFKLGDSLYTVAFDSRRWRQFHNTPLWLEVHGKTWNSKESRNECKHALSKFEVEAPKRLFDDNGLPVVALILPTGVTEDIVIQSIIDQIIEVSALLK